MSCSLPLSRTGDEVGVDRELLARPAAGEEARKDGEVLEAGDDLLYTHDDDVDRRDAGDEPGVPLVGDRGDRPRLGHPEVGPGDADVGAEELFAQAPAGTAP